VSLAEENDLYTVARAVARQALLGPRGVAMIVVSGAAGATAKTPPKAMLSARMRAIGTEAQHALLALPPTTPSSDPTGAAAEAAQLQAIYQRVVRRMTAVTPPKAIAADFKILRGSYQAAAKYAGLWQDFKGYYFGSFFR
jgi:hypothetical protein